MGNGDENRNNLSVLTSKMVLNLHFKAINVLIRSIWSANIPTQILWYPSKFMFVSSPLPTSNMSLEKSLYSNGTLVLESFPQKYVFIRVIAGHIVIHSILDPF